MNQYIIGYLVVINVIAMVMMGLDKRRAIINKWRISEKTLVLIALIGGALGIFIAMKLFRHKINNPLFNYGIPLIILLYYFIVRIFILDQTSFLIRNINFFD